MFLESKRFIKPTVETLNAGTFLVDIFPSVAAAGKGSKDSWITFNVDSDIVAYAAPRFTFAFELIMLSGTAVLQSVTAFLEPAKSHRAFVPFNGTVAINSSLVIMADVTLSVNQPGAVDLPKVPYIDHRLDTMLVPEFCDKPRIILSLVAKEQLCVFKHRWSF